MRPRAVRRAAALASALPAADFRPRPPEHNPLASPDIIGINAAKAHHAFLYREDPIEIIGG